MLPFTYRHNRFSQSYLVNFNNYEFEAEPDLFHILTVYYTHQDYDRIYQELSAKGIFIGQENLEEIITSIEQSSHQFSPELRSRTFKVLDFSLFNRLLDHTYLTWSIIIVMIWFMVTHSDLLEQFFVLPKASEYTFSNILFIVPIYYLSRLIFTPVHEFGHYLFYYLFTKKSASFYIQFPGFTLLVSPPPMICSILKIPLNVLLYHWLVLALNLFFLQFCYRSYNILLILFSSNYWLSESF